MLREVNTANLGDDERSARSNAAELKFSVIVPKCPARAGRTDLIAQSPEMKTTKLAQPKIPR